MKDNQSDNINFQIDLLNALYPKYSKWQIRKAQKDHIDLFEKEIKDGEYYYRLDSGIGLSYDIKLSIDSMHKFLFALFEYNEDLSNYAHQQELIRIQHLNRKIENRNRK